MLVCVLRFLRQWLLRLSSQVQIFLLWEPHTIILNGAVFVHFLQNSTSPGNSIESLGRAFLHHCSIFHALSPIWEYLYFPLPFLPNGPRWASFFISFSYAWWTTFLMTCLLLNQHTSSSKTDSSCSSETSVSSHKTAQCHNPVDHNLNTCRCFTKCNIS